MRVATWNCQTSPVSNWSVVEALNADVLALQECGPATGEHVAALDEWTCVWQQGRYRTKGLAILARSPYRIQDLERSEPCVASVLVARPGGHLIRFVGFWAMTPRVPGVDTYPAQASTMIERLPRDVIPTVVAGDFNASSRNAHHLRNMHTLADLGLVSAYHVFHGIEHTGAWQHATSYHRWQESRPYHMDYVFVPAVWRIDLVKVGAFADYCGRGLSDHMPIVVSVEPKH